MGGCGNGYERQPEGPLGFMNEPEFTVTEHLLGNN